MKYDFFQKKMYIYLYLRGNMLKKRASYISVRLLLLTFLFGYSFAQEFPQSDFNPFLDPTPAQQEPPPPAPPPPVAPPQPISIDSIPQGFGAQLMKKQEPPPPPVVETPAPPPVAQPVSSSSVIVVSSSSVVPPMYKFYEDYLDSLITIARSLMPIKEKFESQKALVNSTPLKPRTEYESQQSYDARAAGFEEEKKRKIKQIDSDYKVEANKRIGKLKDAINYKDIQPEWEGILMPDTTKEGYMDRIARLNNKIPVMERRTTQVYETLAGLDILSSGNLSTLDEKNRIYLARLARAKELMNDYMLQDVAKVSRTEKKKVSMYLGEYDVDKQEFEFVMNDANSATVPFDYIGKIKISPQTAQEIDRRTDDFTVSLDYINYPFFLGDIKLFPGAKRAYVFYKDEEFPNTGVFRNVPGFEAAPGYVEWAMYADSIISGKIKYRDLDSSYAMKRTVPKVGTFWSRNKNIIRGTLLGIAAVSTGIAIYQNGVAGDKRDDMKKTYGEAGTAFIESDSETYDAKKAQYEKEKGDLRSAENTRNGFYVTAGLFGVAGAVCFFF
jgi:hypothetical protein